MTTLFLEWGDDLKLMCRTSLQTAVGWDEVRQRIVRRIVTNPSQQLPDGTFTPADYIFDQNYGAGLGAEVGQDFNDADLAVIRQKITQGVLADAAVETSIPPSISFAHVNPSTVDIIVSVTLLAGGAGEIQLSASR